VNVPAGDLLGEIGRHAGATIRGQLPEGGTVSAHFEDVPLPEALHRLFGDQNFALVYDDRRRLRTIDLLGTPPPATGLAAAPPPAAAPPGVALGLLDRHPPVALGDRLSRALGAETMPLRALIETSLGHADRRVRADALRRALDVVEGEPELQAALVQAVAGMDEGSLVTLVADLAGSHAEEALVHLSSRAQNPTVRTKAASVLHQLRAQARGAPPSDS
jgi:hypothetical protein